MHIKEKVRKKKSEIKGPKIEINDGHLRIGTRDWKFKVIDRVINFFFCGNSPQKYRKKVDT
jgi:acyl CoA:acetate/3-ketoacid CoA transferase